MVKQNKSNAISAVLAEQPAASTKISGRIEGEADQGIGCLDLSRQRQRAQAGRLPTVTPTAWFLNTCWPPRRVVAKLGSVGAAKSALDSLAKLLN